MNSSISKEASKRIRGSRERMNILKESEFQVIEYLCTKMPNWVSPDLLTATGILGSMIIAAGLILAVKISSYFLLLSVFGFAVQWFGDSLDGRLAYYRNTPRKWYGWALDINADWISICVIGLGFYYYFPFYKSLAFIFVVCYGGSMILSLLQYKLNDKYVIDKNSMGPTELRIIICLVLLLEIIIPNALIAFSAIASVILIVSNVLESKNVLQEGDMRDAQDKIKKRRMALNVA